MSVRGQRFNIDLSSDDEIDAIKPTTPLFAPSPALGLVGDIKERLPSGPKPPSPPKLKNSESGFPAHKKRSRLSAFKQSKVNQPSNTDEQHPARASIPQVQNFGHGKGQGAGDSAEAQKDSLSMLDEGRTIDEENRQRISQMSMEEIEEARKELLTGLSP